MAIKEGLRTIMNQIRETSINNNTLYHTAIDEIQPYTDITSVAQPLLQNPDLMNEFIKTLSQKIIYSRIAVKAYKNKLAELEGEEVPLGSIGEEIFINPAIGRGFNIDDFAGLLSRYESDIKVDYTYKNCDNQYPVTITRNKIKDAFTSWGNLEKFIDGITQSLYSGMNIDRYNTTKGLIAFAYNNNAIQYEVVNNPTTKQYAEDLLVKMRKDYLNMKEPSTDYNAWKKVGGYGRAIESFIDENDEDFVVFVKNEFLAFSDVALMASYFNIEYAKMLGKVYSVKDFSIYDRKTGTKLIDGDNIVAFIGSKKWFKIRPISTEMDEFYNPNNRTWQLYLNDERAYNYSFFASGKLYVTEAPQVTISSITPEKTEVTLTSTTPVKIKFSTNPYQANYPSITVTSSDSSKATASLSETEEKTVVLTAVANGSTTVTITTGTVSATISVTVSGL